MRTRSGLGVCVASRSDPLLRDHGVTGAASAPVVVGRQQRYYELPAAIAMVAGWTLGAISEGASTGIKYVWILAIGVVLGTWVLRMRLVLRGSVLEFAIVGLWRHRVDLRAVKSIAWKRTGGPGSKGVIVVRDGYGSRIQIPVGRLSGMEVWGNMLLEAAARSGATIDDIAGRLLEEAVTRTPGD